MVQCNSIPEVCVCFAVSSKAKPRHETDTIDILTTLEEKAFGRKGLLRKGPFEKKGLLLPCVHGFLLTF